MRQVTWSLSQQNIMKFGTELDFLGSKTIRQVKKEMNTFVDLLSEIQ